ncbi:MAG: hypothetical protein HKN12_07815, partial [Gemmatimonadetes bacterium]|nr:hypothetical protein [Gemmatimonadota bacterium]
VDLRTPEPLVEELRGEDGVYVRVRMRHVGMTEEEGRPEVPLGSFQVAVPPGTTPALRVISQQWSEPRAGAVTPLPERVAVRDPFGPDRVEEKPPVRTAAYRTAGSYPSVPFRLSEVRDLRGLRTVNVMWHGVVAETAADRYRVLESARLEVRFVPDTRRAAVPQVRAAPDELWDRTRRGAVVNADVAGAWVRRGPGDAASVGDTPWGGGNQVKVRVDDTGLVRFRYSDLAAAGFPSGVPVAQVSVYFRTFNLDAVDSVAVAAADLFVPVPVPVQVRDDGNGIFDGGDSIVLYGRSFRDQWMTSGWEHEDKFQTSNFYFVRADPVGGARMTARAAQLASAAADSLMHTPSSVFREEDRRYHDRPADFGQGSDGFESEFFYWNNGATATGGETGWSFNDPFTVIDPVPGRDATLVARVCGGGRPVLTNFSNITTYTINGTQVGEDSFYNNNLYATQVVLPDRVLWTHTIPAAALNAGTNTFTFRGRTYAGSGLTNVFQVARFLFDWYEITYDRALIANNGGLRVSTENGTAADQRIRVRGFSGADIHLFDITDPANPVSVTVDPSQIVAGGGANSDLRFGHDNSGGPATYMAFRESAIPAAAASAMTAIAPPTLLAGGNGARWVAVAYDDFEAATQELAAHRALKHTTRVARLSEVYDVFNNGARHPRAIKSYAAYAYQRWTDPLAFLLLVGDANEDHRGITVESDQDYLPSHSLWASYEGAPEESDQYYAEVTRDGGGSFDDLSDIYVGRMSVGTPEEMEWNVERIKRYETEDLDGAWRRRGLFVGDDAFSGSLGGGLGDPYAFKSIELNFCQESAAYADSLLQHPYDALMPELLCMGDWSHPCSSSCYSCGFSCDEDTISCETQTPGLDCGFWYDCRTESTSDPNEWLSEYTCMRQSMKAAVLPVLRGKLNDGVLFWNYQGHANRFFLAHEEVWRDDPIAARHDVETLENFGRPFIFLGFACHLAEFDKSDEA